MRKKVNKKLIVALLSFVLLFGGTFGSSLAWLLDKTETPVVNTFSTSNIEIDLTESELQPDGTLDEDKQVKKNSGYKMIPGHTIDKDPRVTVFGNSEDCWLFVEIEENLGAWDDDELGDNKDPAFTDFLSYSIDENEWTRGTGDDEGGNGVPTNVYFREVTSSTADQMFEILEDNKITVSGDITKTLMEEIDGYKIENDIKVNDSQEVAERPTLSFKAYAVQLWSTNKPVDLADEEAVNEAQFTAAQAWAKRPTT